MVLRARCMAWWFCGPSSDRASVKDLSRISATGASILAGPGSHIFWVPSAAVAGQSALQLPAGSGVDFSPA
jgi:hypothetical protein